MWISVQKGSAIDFWTVDTQPACFFFSYGASHSVPCLLTAALLTEVPLILLVSVTECRLSDYNCKQTVLWARPALPTDSSHEETSGWCATYRACWLSGCVLGLQRLVVYSDRNQAGTPAMLTDVFRGFLSPPSIIPPLYNDRHYPFFISHPIIRIQGAVSAVKQPTKDIRHPV
jgi:hypothetical protein